MITGATGAIGQMILEQLSVLGLLSNVTVFVRDSRNTTKVLQKFSDAINIVYGDITNLEDVKTACHHQDVVIHLAAVIPPFSENHVELGYKINRDGVANVVKAMEEVAPSAFLLFSSSIVVYGDRLKNPHIRATDKLDEEQHDNYGVAKIQAERIIQNSSLNWSIFRLTAIMGVGNHKVSGIMFDVPLETPMEIATVRDTARAFIHAINKKEVLNRKIFNLSGGEKCQISYLEFLTRSFRAFGMGEINFPKYAFAFQNFHCGYYADGDELEKILKFRTDTIDTYFKRVHDDIPAIQRAVTLPFGWIVKKYLLSLSKPYKAFKRNDAEGIKHYFGEL